MLYSVSQNSSRLFVRRSSGDATLPVSIIMIIIVIVIWLLIVLCVIYIYIYIYIIACFGYITAAYRFSGDLPEARERRESLTRLYLPPSAVIKLATISIKYYRNYYIFCNY